MSKGPTGNLSPADWRLMRALWDAAEQEGRATARQVLEALEPGTPWAYTTVKTMLDRLAEKRVVGRERRGIVVQYRPKWSREVAERRAVDALREGVFGGQTSPLVHHLIAEERLSPKDREVLRRLLERSGIDPKSMGGEA